VHETEARALRNRRFARRRGAVFFFFPTRQTRGFVTSARGAPVVPVTAHERLHVVRQERRGRGDALRRRDALLFLGEQLVAETLMPQLVRAVSQDQDVRGPPVSNFVPVPFRNGGARAVALCAAQTRLFEETYSGTYSGRQALLRHRCGEGAYTQEQTHRGDAGESANRLPGRRCYTWIRDGGLIQKGSRVVGSRSHDSLQTIDTATQDAQAKSTSSGDGARAWEVTTTGGARSSGLSKKLGESY
tara:strand:+ start:1729 stop:2463 length:735 start_codon:yes stop_codon:yes gene_type:complete